MLTKLFFPDVRGLRVERIVRDSQRVSIMTRTTSRAARCSRCGRWSRRVHSRYQRTIADLPCSSAPVTIRLTTRRFVCRVPTCPCRIFTERLPALVAPSARRTLRLRATLEREGFALGGEPAARHAHASGMPVSPRTLLRLVCAAPLPPVGAVRVLSIDDWALRKGQTYGRIVVNLETHLPIDLLRERTAATVTPWLEVHPEVEILCRDRAGAYAQAGRDGAPQAIQVADRFHLLMNLREMVEAVLRRQHTALRDAAQAVVAAPQAVASDPVLVVPAMTTKDSAPAPISRCPIQASAAGMMRPSRWDWDGSERAPTPALSWASYRAWRVS